MGKSSTGIMSMATLPTLWLALMGFAVPGLMRAQEESGTREIRSEDGIPAAIEIRDSEALASPFEQRKARRTAWMQALGLDLAFTYDALSMGALAEDAGWGGASGDATLNLRWQINADTNPQPFSLNLRARHRHAYSELAPSELRTETGLLWGLVDGFTDADFQLPEFYLEHRLFEQRLTFRYGQMTIDDLLDGHQLRSAKRSFMNQAFSSSPGVGFPGSDLGFVGRWQSRNAWDLTLGVSHVDASNLNEATTWRLLGEALFQGLQFGRDFSGWRGRDARLQLLAWRSDALPEREVPAGRGLSVTVEQDWAGRQRSFLRYAWADGQAAVTQHFAAAGMAVDLRRFDRLGLSVGGGSASEAHGGWQGVVELFYRRQIGRYLRIAPDVQLVFGDGGKTGGGSYVVGGLRAGLSF